MSPLVRSSSIVAGVVGLVIAGCAEPPAPSATQPPIETRETLRKTTQNVLELSKALVGLAELGHLLFESRHDALALLV